MRKRYLALLGALMLAAGIAGHAPQHTTRLASDDDTPTAQRSSWG